MLLFRQAFLVLKMASHEEYDQFTKGSDVAATFSERIRDRNGMRECDNCAKTLLTATVIITGVSPESLGATLAITIAKHSPGHLILASRTQAKLDEVLNTIKEDSPAVHVDTVQLDLSSQSSIRESASQISALTDRVDILINNAAVNHEEHHYTKEGIELQFGTNHVGHFLFTNLLLDHFTTAAQSSPKGSTRIVNVSSLGYRLSPVRFHDYNLEGKPVPSEEEPPSWVPDKFRPKEGTPYSAFVSYAQSKTANILFSVALTERLQEEGIISYAVHPGCEFKRSPLAGSR